MDFHLSGGCLESNPRNKKGTTVFGDFNECHQIKLFMLAKKNYQLSSIMITDKTWLGLDFIKEVSVYMCVCVRARACVCVFPYHHTQENSPPNVSTWFFPSADLSCWETRWLRTCQTICRLWSSWTKPCFPPFDSLDKHKSKSRIT